MSTRLRGMAGKRTAPSAHSIGSEVTTAVVDDSLRPALASVFRHTPRCAGSADPAPTELRRTAGLPGTGSAAADPALCRTTGASLSSQTSQTRDGPLHLTCSGARRARRVSIQSTKRIRSSMRNRARPFPMASVGSAATTSVQPAGSDLRHPSSSWKYTRLPFQSWRCSKTNDGWHPRNSPFAATRQFAANSPHTTRLETTDGKDYRL